MCAVIIMGHGFDGVIFGRDGEKVNIRMDILDQFSNENCSAMIDKPKMFVFQSCRGLRRDTGVFNKKCLIRFLNKIKGVQKAIHRSMKRINTYIVIENLVKALITVFPTMPYLLLKLF